MRRAAVIVVVALAACAGVLGLHDRRNGPFEHRPHVTRGVSCLRCHAGIEKAGETGELHLPGTADCRSCHARPHDERDCRGCHGMPHTGQTLADARTHLRFAHDRHVPRLNGACTPCHVDVAREGATLLPRMATCLSCHDHDQDWDRRQCDRCHADLEVEAPLPISHVSHEGDFLREHGTRARSEADLCATCHTQRFCGGCHGVRVPVLPGQLMFDDPLVPSIHRAGFRSRHAEEARAAPGNCLTCHTQEESCRGCHVRENVASIGAPNPHPAGWLGIGENAHGRAARLDPLSCASCHGGAGEALCVGCHRAGGAGGNPHPPGWRSDRSRDALPCRLCHAP